MTSETPNGAMAISFDEAMFSETQAKASDKNSGGPKSHSHIVML